MPYIVLYLVPGWPCWSGQMTEDDYHLVQYRTRVAVARQMLESIAPDALPTPNALKEFRCAVIALEALDVDLAGLIGAKLTKDE